MLPIAKVHWSTKAKNKKQRSARCNKDSTHKGVGIVQYQQIPLKHRHEVTAPLSYLLHKFQGKSTRHRPRNSLRFIRRT